MSALALMTGGTHSIAVKSRSRDGCAPKRAAHNAPIG